MISTPMLLRLGVDQHGEPTHCHGRRLPFSFSVTFQITGETDMSSHDNRTWLSFAIVAVVIAAYFILRPHPPTVGELVGEWNCTSRPWTISFNENGAIAMSTIGPTQVGEYEVDAKGNLRVMMRDGGRFKASLSMWFSQLTVTDADGMSSSFQRSRSRY
jgi:hypothetical protein